MKKKLLLLSVLAASCMLAGCRVTINGSSSPTAKGFFGLVLLGFGIWYYSNPESAFHFSEGWRYRDLEPSDAGLDGYRLGGLAGIIIGILLLFSSCMA
jgi:hypothetical protein